MGHNNNSGLSATSAFATITKARDVVRTVNGNMTGDIVVFLLSGTYEHHATLSFNASDSGNNGHNVYYKAHSGAVPVISGGKKITDWMLHDGSKNIYRAKVSTTDNFRQLYVNGVRATRAKGGAFPDVAFSSDNTYLTTSDKTLIGYKNQSNIELVSYREWAMQRALVSSITDNGVNAKLTMLAPYFSHMRTQHSAVYFDAPKWIENAYELVDTEKEWYLDRSAGMLYYKPATEENVSSLEIVAPTVEKLVEVKGTLTARVHNIVFDGLTFSHATWLTPSAIGHSELQALQQMPVGGGRLTETPANIIVDSAKAIQFQNCTFCHIGNVGLDLRFTQETTVHRCSFYDISGSGIQVLGFVNDPNPSDPNKICKNNIIARNRIHDVCVEYYGGVGIFVGYAEGTSIQFNEIYNVPYSGISVGFGWSDYPVTICKRNKILNNHVHDYTKLLRDGGGVYTLGPQPDSICSRNFLSNMVNQQGALYLDEGSAYYAVDRNVIEVAPYWLFIWTNTIHDISCADNYTAVTNLRNNGTRCTVAGTVTYGFGDRPLAAQEIIDNAGPSGVALHQAEALAHTTSSGDTITRHNETAAGGGVIDKLNSGALNDYVIYTVPNVPAGNYTVRVRYKTNTTLGKFQLAIDGINQGEVVDQYGSVDWPETSLGTVSLRASGNKQFKFLVVGKNPASSGYVLTFDSVRLINHP